jgi:hypothetical protein
MDDTILSIRGGAHYGDRPAAFPLSVTMIGPRKTSCEHVITLLASYHEYLEPRLKIYPGLQDNICVWRALAGPDDRFCTFG